MEETPDYLAAVRVKLNNPGVGKAGLRERHKNIFPRGSTRQGANAAPGAARRDCPGFPGMKGKPGMSWQTPGAGLADELCPSISARQAPRAGRGINQTERGRGEKVSEGELGGLRARGRRGNEKAARGRGKTRSKAEIHQR